MVVSRQAEIPFYSGFGRQRRHDFGGLEEVIRRAAIPFLRQYIVLAQNPWVLTSCNLLGPILQMLLVVEKN